MYFRRKTSAGRAYLQIVESRREGDRVRQQVIATLGRFEDLRASGQLGRLAALGRSGSWPEIIADLDSLTETEIEQDGKRFTVRSAPRPAASLAIRGVALPPTVREASA
jgi:hypothetical protein